MKELRTVVQSYARSIKYWWGGLILGILFIGVGVLVFRYPGESYLSLTILFGAMILVSGIFQLFVAANLPKGRGKGWVWASAIIEVILGLILCLNIAMSAIVLPVFLGFWMLFRGISMVGIANDLRDYGIRGTGWTIAWAILLMLFAFLVLIHPAIGIGAIVIWLGIAFMTVGVAMIFNSFYLKSMKKHYKELVK